MNTAKWLLAFSLASHSLMSETLTCKTYNEKDTLLSTNTLNLRKDDPADSYAVEVHNGKWKHILNFSVWRADGSTRHVVHGEIYSIDDQNKKHLVSGFHQDTPNNAAPMDYDLFFGDFWAGNIYSAFKVRCQ